MKCEFHFNQLRTDDNNLSLSPTFNFPLMTTIRPRSNFELVSLIERLFFLSAHK